MGLFNFAKSAGETLRNALGGKGKEDTDAADLVKALQDNGVTIEHGKVVVVGDKVTITGQASNQAEKQKAIVILGNTKGVASVDDQLTVAAAPQAAQPQTGASPAQAAPAQPQQQLSQFYEVKSGDTLSKIAKQFYGEANKYPQIFEANKPMLKDPDKIYPGQTLIIPPEQ